MKRTALGGDGTRNLEFRAEAANILNRTVFGGVNVNLADPNFGDPVVLYDQIADRCEIDRAVDLVRRRLSGGSDPVRA